MSATCTKIKGTTPLGDDMMIACYSVLFDNSYPTGGEAIDLSSDFAYIYAAIPNANDTAADNGYKFSVLHPGYTTAVTSSNVLIQAHWTGTGDSAVFNEFTNTGDLSSVGSLLLLVIGKQA